MRLFFKILVILGIAVIGLFFVYNNGYFNQQEEYPNYLQSSGNEAKNESSGIPQGVLVGDPKIKKQIKVDLGQQKVYLFENGQIVKEYPISSGKLEMPTPIGNFRVIYKSSMIYSKITDCWLPFWAGFTNDGKYGFHEVPICEGERVGIKEIGKPASVGCLRLKQGDAEEFYNWVEIETPVEIYGQTR